MQEPHNRMNISISFVEKPRQNYCENLDLKDINYINTLIS